jgi:hypothetical protein
MLRSDTTSVHHAIFSHAELPEDPGVRDLRDVEGVNPVEGEVKVFATTFNVGNRKVEVRSLEEEA